MIRVLNSSLDVGGTVFPGASLFTEGALYWHSACFPVGTS